MENTNRKELRIVRGEEYKIQIRGSLTEQDPFWNQYEMATNILEQILSDAKKEANVNAKCKIMDCSLDYNNNIIAFCGERGDGKSSAMMSFIHELKKNNNQNKLFYDKENIKSTEVVDVIYIDPTTFDHMHSVLDIVLAFLFRNFKAKYESQKEEESKWIAEELIASFQNVYKFLSIIKDSQTILSEEFDASGSISKLAKLSESINLKEELRALLKMYGKYMSTAAPLTPKVIIAIDDLDLSMTHAYNLTEQIRKYLIIPEVVVIMAVRGDQLNLTVQEYDASQLKQLALLGQNDKILSETQGMSAQYTSKLIPMTHMIYLPKIQDWENIDITIIDENGNEKQEIMNTPVVEAVLTLIYRKTGMVFLADGTGHSMLLPDNLRGVVNFIVYLNSLETPEVGNSYERKLININGFLRMYVGMLLQALPIVHTSLDIQKKIKNIALHETAASMHLEAANILQDINVSSVPSWGELEKNNLYSNWQAMVTDTFRGRNSLHFIIQGLNFLTVNNYGYEVRKQLYALQTLYTIKANLAQLRSHFVKKEKFAFYYYTDAYIWGPLLNSLLPDIILRNGMTMSRVRISIPTDKIFNCIADQVGLTDEYRFSATDNLRVKNFNCDDPVEKNKFIFTWIIMALLSNGYLFIQQLNKEQYQSVVYIYLNHTIQQYKQISIENYFIMPALLDVMYELLNIKTINISKDEFESVLNTIKKYNSNLIKTSELITANVDIILYLSSYIHGEYKSGTNSPIERTRELVSNVFKKISSELKQVAGNEILFSLTADDLRYIRWGSGEENRIDIAELYAKLIDSAYNYRLNIPKRDPSIEEKTQSLRDILDLKSVSKYPRAYVYSSGTNKSTKWGNLRDKIEKMVRSISSYMYLSKNYKYISLDKKNSICNFYTYCLEQERENPNQSITDKAREIYSSLTKDYSAKTLKKAIEELQKQ